MAVTAGTLTLTPTEASILTTATNASVRISNDGTYPALLGPTGNPVHQLKPGMAWEFKATTGLDAIFGRCSRATTQISWIMVDD